MKNQTHLSALAGFYIYTTLPLCVLVQPGVQALRAADRVPEIRTGTCPVELPGLLPGFRAAGGGCNADPASSWLGPLYGPVALLWHVEGTTADLGAGQRRALIKAMKTWADVAPIYFFETPVANLTGSLDFNFFTLDHSVQEPQEAGDSDCPFDGANGTLAHAAFPPGANSLCSGTIHETFAGNVHFDDDEKWEEDDGDQGAFSLSLVAAHEIGHALGLVHTSCSTDLMRPSVSSTEKWAAPSANDIANIRLNYRSDAGANVGSVVTLEEYGIWVDRAFTGQELGQPERPFNTLAEGVAGVPPHTEKVIVHLQRGSYPESMTIDRALILRAENGPVTIGSL